MERSIPAVSLYEPERTSSTSGNSNYSLDTYSTFTGGIYHTLTKFSILVSPYMVLKGLDMIELIYKL